MLERHEDVDQLEARLARPEIDGGQLGQKRERELRPIAQQLLDRRADSSATQ